MWKPWNSCCVGWHKCYIKCLVSVHVCLRTGKGYVMPLKKHHPVLPRFPDWLTVWLRLCFLFFTQSTHTTGSQVFSGSSPPQPLPYPSVSLSTRVREADWQGCGVYQWCDVFEHCLPLGDETLRWGSGVFVWERKRQREAFAPREYSVHVCYKKHPNPWGAFIERHRWGFHYKSSFGFMMSWWNSTLCNQTTSLLQTRHPS